MARWFFADFRAKNPDPYHPVGAGYVAGRGKGTRVMMMKGLKEEMESVKKPDIIGLPIRQIIRSGCHRGIVSVPPGHQASKSE